MLTESYKSTTIAKFQLTLRIELSANKQIEHVVFHVHQLLLQEQKEVDLQMKRSLVKFGM